MPAGCELPNAEQRERILLSLWYRTRHHGAYRRSDEKVLGSTVDPETGIELSEADLRAPGDAIRGPELVFACPVMPDRLAEETLLRDEWDGSTPSFAHVLGLAITTDQPDVLQPGTTRPVIVFRCPTNERGRAEEELLQVRKLHPEWNARIRQVQGREAWTEEEAAIFADWHYQWQLTLLSFAERGWVVLRPPLLFESDTGNNEKYAKGVDDKGLPYIATVTPAGLEEAERRISGDSCYSQGPVSSLVAMSGEMRAKVMATSPWAAKKYQKEGS